MYKIECPICDMETTVEVHYDPDAPQHCPMCGSDAEPITLEEDSDE